MNPVKRIRQLATRVMLSLGIVLCSHASVAQTERIELPDMGNSASSILSRKEEQQYANALLRQMRAMDILVTDPLINDYFRNIGYRLASHSDKPEMNFHFVVLKEPRVNAFAAPGGVIALHSGLILAADNEHEVAGVLAHEVAHITQLHLYRALENSQRMTIPIALAMLGLILAGGGSGDAVSGALMGGTALSAQSQINYTRHNEYEADRLGITTLSRAGFNPDGMAGFFSKLQRLTRPNGEGPPEFLRTHPVTVNRIAEARNRAANMPRPAGGNSLEFLVMQSRLRALHEDKPAEAITWFRDQLGKGHGQPRDTALRYGLAIALQRDRQFDEARSILQALLAEDPDRLAYQLQIADLYLDQDEVGLALEVLGTLYHSFPGNHAISMQYAKALLANKDQQRAETASIILRQQLLERDDDPSLYALYARAANTAGDHVRATEAIAESYYQRGGIREAIDQLERLNKDDELDYYERARVTARLMELRIELAELRDDGQRS